MTEQIPLKGFSQQHLTDLDEPGVLGRESDRSTDCRRLVDAVGGHCRLVIESKNILPVAIFTLGRFSILIKALSALSVGSIYTISIDT